MDDARFLRALRQIKPILYEDIGLAISFWNIYETLSPYGEDKDSISWRIEQLERQRKLEVFRQDSVIFAVRILP